MVFIRKIKKKSGVYLAEVEGYRDDAGKVRQRVIRYLGKEVDGKPEKRVLKSDIEVKSVKHSFDVLAVDAVAKELQLTTLANKYSLALVYSQVLEKHSINQLEGWMQFTEIPDVLGVGRVSTKELYESLGEINEQELAAINEKLYGFFRKHEPSCDVAVIDVTDTYFAGAHEEIKRRKGKDGKVEKLIQIGLAVSFKHGFPLFHKKYQGNLSNVHVFKDMAIELQARRLKGVIVDRGMTSNENIALMKSLNLKIIGGLKKTASLVGQYLSTVRREELYSLKHRVVLKNTTVFVTSFPYLDGELIVVYNPALEVVKKEQLFIRDKESGDPYLGYSLIYHNTKYEVASVVRQYYEKEIVERAFKQLKGVLNLRPIRVWLKNHIEGHISICYLAYAMLAYMNYKLRKTNTSATEALNSLKHGYRVTLKTGKEEWSLHVPLEPKQKDILKALGVVYKK